MMKTPCGARRVVASPRLRVARRWTIAAVASCLVGCGVTTHAAAATCAQATKANADDPVYPVVHYEVVIDAPDDLKPLIVTNLGLATYAGEGGKKGCIDADRLHRLFDEGREEAARLVTTQGYFTPTITADLKEEGDQWIATYTVVPHAVTHVTSVDLSFVGPIEHAPPSRLPDRDAIRAAWSLKAGDVFRQADWEADKRRLLQALLLQTYPFATLTRSEAEVDVRTDTARLTVVIASGPAVRFGALQISGLDRYPPATIRNIDPIAIGDLYSQAKLFDFQQKLSNSGYFSRVDVSVETNADPGSDPRSPSVAKQKDAAATDVGPAPVSPLPAEVTLPLRVSVTENKSQTVSLGIGASSNAGPHATATYNVLDFLGGAEQLRTTLAFDRLNQTLGADLLFPTTVSGDRYSLSSALTRTNVQNEITRGGTASAKRTWGPGDTEQFQSVDYIFERRSIDGLPDTTAQTIGPTYGITLRRTDNALTPTTGYLATATAGVGVRLTNGLPFARLYGKAIRFVPITTNNTLIVRGEVGAVVAHDPISMPTSLLFRAGGLGSVRGYGYQSLGVREGDAIVGGRYVTTGTLEIDHWLAPWYPQWGVAGFVDAGNAGNVLADLSPVVGYGLGVRWRSPVGTLDLDVAHGISNGSTRIHFALGVSF